MTTLRGDINLLSIAHARDTYCSRLWATVLTNVDRMVRVREPYGPRT